MIALHEIAAAVHDWHGRGMELEARPLSGDAWLRVWVPTLASAGGVSAAARRHGFHCQTPVPHLPLLDSLEYVGFQLVVLIPAAAVAEAKAAMAEATEIAAGRLELGPGV